MFYSTQVIIILYLKFHTTVTDQKYIFEEIRPEKKMHEQANPNMEQVKISVYSYTTSHIKNIHLIQLECSNWEHVYLYSQESVQDLNTSPFLHMCTDIALTINSWYFIKYKT